jgi:hypothetical protein
LRATTRAGGRLDQLPAALDSMAVPSERMRTPSVPKERVTSQPHDAIPVSEYPQGSGSFHVRGDQGAGEAVWTRGVGLLDSEYSCYRTTRCRPGGFLPPSFNARDRGTCGYSYDARSRLRVARSHTTPSPIDACCCPHAIDRRMAVDHSWAVSGRTRDYRRPHELDRSPV